jgi:hypothetical protein
VTDLPGGADTVCERAVDVLARRVLLPSGRDPGRLLAQVGDRLQDVPAALTFELMDPTHPIVDAVLDQGVRAAVGALGMGSDHARSIDACGASAHRPFGWDCALVEVRYRGMLGWSQAALGDAPACRPLEAGELGHAHDHQRCDPKERCAPDDFTPERIDPTSPYEAQGRSAHLRH